MKPTTLPSNNSINDLGAFLLVLLLLACFALPPGVQAVSPPPDGCYAEFTTVEGCNSLQSLTTGVGNTGLGWYSLFANSIGSYNTAIGAGALDLNNGDNNTATGVAALLLNTSGIQNTANGSFALYNNSAGGGNIAIGYYAGSALTTGNNNIAIGNIGVAGESNTIRIGDLAIHTGIFLAGITAMDPTAPNQAVLVNPSTGQLGSTDVSRFGVVITDPGNTSVGDQALASNTGGDNTANGYQALTFNTSGDDNVAVGTDALASNDSGADNNAIGSFALFSNVGGFFNNAHGREALFSNLGSENDAFGDLALESITTGNSNTAIGDDAGDSIVDGSFNVAVGDEAGTGIVHASNVIAIGAAGADVSNRCYIGQIFGVTSSGGTAVFINSSGQLGTVTSSRRFKEEIQPMDKASDALLALKPVTFRYKKEIDPKGLPQFGLVAEEVEKVNPDLVVRDEQGKPYTVRYEAVNAMLLNEFLKEHGTVQELKSAAAKQEATIARQQKQIEALTAGLQKVSAQGEARKPAPRVVNNP